MSEPRGRPHLHLDLTDCRRHLVLATLRLMPRTATTLLRLPAWTPGSYLIRDYVHALEGLRAEQNGKELFLERLEPACWRMRSQCETPVVLHWRLLATELTVRTCHLNDDHGFLCLAGVALQVEGERWSPHRLSLSLPEGWQPFLSLPQAQDGWIARDFDQLIDSPIEAGPHPCHSFSVAGVPHRWVGWGDDLPSQDPRWLEDVSKVALACCRLMGVERPASDGYLFVLHLLEKGFGGLEHNDGCVLHYGRQALRDPQGRRHLLQLVAHEYLHQWNVRRLRPAELTPIAYDRPVVLPTLWFAEGITSYFDRLIPVAAGLASEAELLDDLGADLSRYRLTPGRRVQSLRESSQEAWVKLYRPDPHNRDSQVSYYLKGAVIALVLDLHLRRHGSALAVVLQELWQSHGRHGRGYREADLLRAFARHGEDLSTLLPGWLDSREDPDLDSILADVGLKLLPVSGGHPFMGWHCGGTMTLERVGRDGPAAAAGLQVGDELLALNAERLRSSQHLDQLLQRHCPAAGSAVTLLFCRDGRIRETPLIPDPPQTERWSLQIDPAAAGEAAEQRRRWLELVP
ncbi:MAG: M61 family metallopeptidase [Cyanobium sp.]